MLVYGLGGLMDKPRLSSLNWIRGRGSVCELGGGAGSSLSKISCGGNS